MIEALYYFVLGGVVMFATLYMLGMYHQFRAEERERDAAEKRIAELPPLSEGWRPDWPQRPMRRNVR